MSKAKLTIEANELEKFKQAFELAEIKVLQVVPMGTLNKVEISYKTEQQLITSGRYVERVSNIAPEIKTEVKNQNKKQNDKHC